MLTRDYPIMIGLSVMLFLVAYSFKSSRRIERWGGGLLAGLYFVYLGLMAYTA
ncbi:hypothetical protein [Litorivivens sp.]|uniref:hypothetical protein n=1 Tax=Litorivivens sp. TaxID=2020868 RepID=UPI0035633337